MNISLTPELESLVNQKVASGLYNSASEVIREGLRLLQEQDSLKQMRLEALRREVLDGHEQSRRGLSQPIDLARIKATGRQRLERKRKSS